MVTAVVNSPGDAVGQVIDDKNLYQYRGKKGTGIITRGQLLVRDTSLTPDGWKVAPAVATPAYAPFGVCAETTLSGDTEVSVMLGGIIALRADATIELGEPVMAATATAGEVIPFVATTVTTTPTGAEVTSASYDESRKVGYCIGFVDNFGTVTPTAPVDGDLAAIVMRR